MSILSACWDGLAFLKLLRKEKNRFWFNQSLQGFIRDWSAASSFFGEFTPPPSSPSSPLVVLAGHLPHSYILKMEGIFAEGFRQRGGRVLTLHPPGDIFGEVVHRLCFGNPTTNLFEYIPWQNLVSIIKTVDSALVDMSAESLKKFFYWGSPVGFDALATISALDPTGKAHTQNGISLKNVRPLLIRSCLLIEAADRFLRRMQPMCVIGVEKGMIGCSEIFNRSVFNKIPYIQWHGCHEPNTIMMKRFHHGNVRTHPFSVSSQTWDEACRQPWDERWESAVFSEFEKGYGTNKWFSYKRLTDNTIQYTNSELITRLGVDPRKKTCIIFAPVLNDANLFFGKDLFAGGFREWLIETIRAAAANPRMNWVLKIHPANRYRRAALGIDGEYGELIAVREALGEVPRWLHLLLPEDDINPLSLFKFLDVALTVRGTVGAEIPCFGKPVLTGGTGRYSGLGFTIDSETTEEYLRRLRNLHMIEPLSEEQVRRAILHAYLFFRVRPAPYEQVAEDIYQYTPNHPYYRDFAFKVPSVKAAAAHPQFQKILEWMIDQQSDDFLNW